MSVDFLNLEQYPAIMERVNSFFYSDKCLPDQVFKRPYRFYLTREFDGGAMLDLLQILQKHHSPLVNDTILLSVLDPHPIDYFYKHFGKINAFIFDGGMTEQDYGAMRRLSPGNAADAIGTGMEIEVYIPSSGSWALWGEHGREMNVLGLDDPALVSTLVEEVGYWMDAENAITDGFASSPFEIRNQKALEIFRPALIENYGTRADLEAKLGKKIQYPWELEEEH